MNEKTITVKLLSNVIEDIMDYGYRKGDLRITVKFLHGTKEIKCIILPPTKLDGVSTENYYDNENVAELWLSGYGYTQRITDHLTTKILEKHFDDKSVGYEYSFEIDKGIDSSDIKFKIL